MTRRYLLPAVVLSLFVATAIAQTPLPASSVAIVPVDGQGGPYSVGDLVRYRVEGLGSAAAGARATIFPRTALLLPVLSGTPDEDTPTWAHWGLDPELLFVAERAGTYTIVILDETGSLCEYQIVVEGEPVPVDLHVTPEAPLAVAGPSGGPFEPRIQRYEVTSALPVHYAARVDAEWLIAVSAEGDTPGSIDVLIGPAADGLAEGKYCGALEITDTKSGTTVTREIVLTVGETPPPPPPPPPPVELLQAVVVEESNDRTAQQAQVMLSTRVRAAVGNRFFVFDDDMADKHGQTPPNVACWIERAKGKSLPYLFLSDAKAEPSAVAWEGPMPESIEKMLSLIAEHQPGSVLLPPGTAKRLPLKQQAAARVQAQADCPSDTCAVR